MASPAVRPPFVDLVVKCLRKRFPPELADSSWDNTGLLVDSVNEPGRQYDTILLTNDLTSTVADEAVERGACLVISYHPFIFSGIKSITLSNPQHVSLLKLIRHGIAVYSPHTAIDSSPFGNNAWLAKVVGGQHDVVLTTVRPVADPPAGLEGAGHGVLGHVSGAGMSLSSVLQRLSLALGKSDTDPLRHFLIARPRGPELADVAVRRFVVAAGSGFGIVRDVDADLVVTGELSHHDALHLVERGRIVVATLHSNSERAFLRTQLQPWLTTELHREMPAATVLVSKKDSDPFVVYEINQ